LKIVYIITGLRIGGAEKMLYNLVKRLDKAKYSVSVISLTDSKFYRDRFTECGVEVIDLKLNKFLSVWRILKLIPIFFLQKVDIIHSVMFHANLLGRFLKLFLRNSVHISGERNTGNRSSKLHVFLNRITAEISDVTLCVSESAAHYLESVEGYDRKKLTVIRNGVDIKPDFFLSPRIIKNYSSAFNVVALGRIVPQKNLEMLILTFAKVKKLIPNAKLTIIGGGESKNSDLGDKYTLSLFRLVNEMNLSDSVLFTGSVLSPDELLKKSDIYIITSHWEGIPNSLLEAMAIGLPCIATDVGGVKEIIRNNFNGKLIESGSEKDLLDAILNLYFNAHIAQYYSYNAQLDANTKYSWSVMVDSNTKIYKKYSQS
jgi:glycosyltransferase involved in cell wall biosynthesis